MTATLGHLTHAELSTNGGVTWIDLTPVLTSISPSSEVAEIEAGNFRSSAQGIIPKLKGASSTGLEITINGGASEAYTAFKNLSATKGIAQLRVYPTLDQTTGFTQFTGEIGSMNQSREDQSVVLVTISFVVQAIPLIVSGGL